MYFFGRKLSLIFWQKGNIIFVTFIHIHRKYHNSLHLLRKIIFHFPSKEKISDFQVKKIQSSHITEERSYSSAIFFVRLSFQNMKEISYFHVFFFLRKFIFHFLSKDKTIFLGKRNIFFPDNTRKIIFQCMFFERSSFQNIWKKKICFFVQCDLHDLST